MFLPPQQMLVTSGSGIGVWRTFLESGQNVVMPPARIVATQTPAELGDFVRGEIVRWGEACKAAGIEPQ